MAKNIGIMTEEVRVQSLGDKQELSRIDGAFEEYLLHSTGCHVDAGGQPPVGFPLPSQFPAYNFAYMYVVHAVPIFCAFASILKQAKKPLKLSSNDAYSFIMTVWKISQD